MVPLQASPSCLAVPLYRLALLHLFVVGGTCFFLSESSGTADAPSSGMAFVNCSASPYASVVASVLSADTFPVAASSTSLEDSKVTTKAAHRRDYNSTSPPPTGSSSVAGFPTGSPLPYEAYYCLWEASGPVNFPGDFPNGADFVQDFDGLPANAQQECMSLQKANYSSWVATASYPPLEDVYNHKGDAWPVFTSPPCCNTVCDVVASAVQLIYWPTPAPQPHITTLVSDGFTFTSPSAYLVYTSLSAYGLNAACDKSQFPHHVTKTTVAYDPNAISSFSDGNLFAPATQVNYADLWQNCSSITQSSVFQNPTACSTDPLAPSCVSAADVEASSFEVGYKHCTPNLVYPSGLNSMFPEWTSCNIAQYENYDAAVFDPPRALVPVNAMAGPTPVQNAAAGVTSAAPAPIAPPPEVTQTPAPVPSTAPSGGGNDPSSQDPVDPQSGDKQSPADPKLSDPKAADPGPGPAPPSPSPPSPPAADPAPSPATGGSDKDPAPAPATGGSDSDPASGPAAGGSDSAPAKPKAADPGSSDTSSSPAAQPAGSPAADPAKASGIPFVIPIQGGSQKQPANPVGQTPSGQIPSGQAPAGQAPAGQAPAGQAPAGQAPAAPPASADPASSSPVNDGQQPQQQQQGSSQPGANSQGSPPPDNNQPVPSAALPSPTLRPTTILGHSIAAAPSPSALLIDGQTVPHGGSTLHIAGTPIALHSNGDLVLGSSTVSSFYTPPPPLAPASQPASLPPSAAAAGAGAGAGANSPAAAGSGSGNGSGSENGGGTPATLLPNNNVAIGSTTLTPNAPAITVAGTPVSLGSSGVMVVGSSTITVPSSSSSSSAGQGLIGVGGFVNSAINGGFTSPSPSPNQTETGPPGSTAGGALAFTGIGVREGVRWEALVGGVLGMVGMLVGG